ncbi:MAG: hypothetical protein PHX14_03865 [Syntrophomonadaceae bacterium]|nr:hypothetical protein [Syntrophomonadaceae bacterium]
MMLSRREKILLTLLLILGLAISYNYLVYQPGQIARKHLIQENGVLISLIERGTSAKAQNLDINQEKTRIVKAGNELMLQIPSSARVPETVAFLKRTARDTHVNLQSINYAINKSKTGMNKNAKANKDILEKVQVLDYNITIQGGYNNLLAFLLKFENAPRLYTINNCRMIANAQKFDEAAISEVLTSLIEDPEAAPVPVPLPIMPKGSAIYDGNSIQLNLKFSAYYEEETIPGLNAGEEEVPAASGKINPFL